MKKVYSKPDIMFESFSLSTSIAAGCELKTNLPSEGACGYPTRAGNVFLSEETGCTYTPPNGVYIPVEGVDSNNGFCYHTPSDANNLFNS